MLSMRRWLLAQAFELFDLLTMAFAFIVAGILTQRTAPWTSLRDALTRPLEVHHVVLLLCLLLVWRVINSSMRLYESRRLASRRRELIDVVKATGWGTAALLVLGTLFRVKGITPLFAVLFCGVSTTILVSSRLVLRPLLARIRVRGHNCRHVVVVGTGPSARRLAEKFEAEPGLGYRLVGFVDDDWAEMDSFRRTGYPLVSTIAEFPRLLEETVVDEVVICLPMGTYYRQASRMVALAQEQGIVVRVRADFFDLQSMRNGPSHESEEFVTLYPGAMDSPTVLAKRLVDIAFSSMLLLLALPVFILVPILIKLDSPGPVFFLQQRRGFNKRPFTMIKFRTMHQNAEQMLDSVKHLMEKAGPGFKIKDDPRITRVGKFLRRTSLDELPQLINVLKGEMSLVGPRPLFAWEFERIEEPWIKRRCSVRPGLTGLWQVSGRSDLPFDKRVELDLQYIDNWSLELDFQILALTLPAVVLGRGAV